MNRINTPPCSTKSSLEKSCKGGIISKIVRLPKTLYSRRIVKKFHSCGKGCYFSKFAQLLGAQYIDIGNKTVFADGCYLTAWVRNNQQPQITIGSGCSIGSHNHITSTNEIRIGDNLLTGKWVTITDNAHGNSDHESLKIAPGKRPVVSKGPVIIHDNVWIGDKATILPGVEIGEGAIIAANAVVTKDVPPYSVAAGVPARIVKKE